MEIPVKSCQQKALSEKSSENRNKSTKASKNKTFTEALKEKYCLDQDQPTFGFIILSPKRKSTVAELAHLKTVVLNEMNLSRAGIPQQGLSCVCPNVVDLDLANNHFDNWSELMAILSHLPRVKYVNVSRNSLRLKQMDEMPDTKLSVENLAVNDTGVSLHDMVLLSPYMPQLKELHLCNNGYDSLSGLEEGIGQGVFSSLETLRLNDNNICSWAEVWRIRNLPNLKCLILSGNPVEGIFYDKFSSESDSCFIDVQGGEEEDDLMGMDIEHCADALGLSQIEVDVNSDSEGTVDDEDNDDDNRDNSFDVTLDSFDGVEGDGLECWDQDGDDLRPVSRLDIYADIEGGTDSPLSDHVLSHLNDLESLGNTDITDRLRNMEDTDCFSDNRDMAYNNSRGVCSENLTNMNFSNRHNHHQQDFLSFPFSLDVMEAMASSTDQSQHRPESEEAEEDSYRLEAEAFLDALMNNLVLGTEKKKGTNSSLSSGDIGSKNDHSLFTACHDNSPVDEKDHSCNPDQGFTAAIQGNTSEDSQTQCSSNTNDANPCSSLSYRIPPAPSENEQFVASVSTSCAGCTFNSISQSPHPSEERASTLSNNGSCSGIERFIANSLQTSTRALETDGHASNSSTESSLQPEKVPDSIDMEAHSESQPQTFQCFEDGPNKSHTAAILEPTIEKSCNPAVRELFPSCDSDDNCESGRMRYDSSSSMEAELSELSNRASHMVESDKDSSKEVTLQPSQNQSLDDHNEREVTESSASLTESVPFQGLEMLCLSHACLNHWTHLHALKDFPKLVNVRISNNPLFDSVGEEDKRKLYIASLPNVKVLNGSEVTATEREKAERHYLRHFMKDEDKPGHYDTLVKKHGQPVELVDINIGYRFHEYATLDFVYEGVVKFSQRLHLRESVGRLRPLIARKLDLPKHSFTMYHHSCGPSHPESERELMELRCESLPMSRFDFADGDQIQVDVMQIHQYV